MPKFTIRLRVTNNSGVPIKAHVGASLVGKDWMEYYNTADDVTRTFNPGKMNSSDTSILIWVNIKNTTSSSSSGRVRNQSGQA